MNEAKELSNIRGTKYFVLSFLVLFLSLNNGVTCGRILFILQAPFYSHHIVLRELSLALHKRGHEIVLVTLFPTKNLSLANYTEIDLGENFLQVENKLCTSWLFELRIPAKLNADIERYIYRFTKYFYDHPDIQKIYRGNSMGKFDLMIAETTQGHGVFYIAHKLNVPAIGVTSLNFQAYLHYMLGNPLLPSHPSEWEFFDHAKLKTTFCRRVQNFVDTMLTIRQWYNFETGRLHDLVKGYLGNDIPSFDDLTQNISLMLSNYDVLMGDVRPLPPNTLYFNGFHIEENPPPLPTSTDEFLGKSHDGFIYMNLGTTINSTMMPPKYLTTIFNVFSRLPYKVVWKFETDNLPQKHENIFISEWMPQQSILAHANIKLFIYQGGVKSTEEAIHYGVPIVGIPIIYDQTYTITKLVSQGVGRMLDFDQLSEETFQEAIIDVCNNKSYKTNMLRLRSLMKDKPYDSRDHAIWWIEYVMRHNGAPHLRFTGADDPWYQRQNMDVIAFLSIISFIAIVICVVIFVKILRWGCRFYKCTKKRNKSD